VEAFATLIDDMEAIPDNDFIPGKFWAYPRNLGKEWVTGPKPARFVGIVLRKPGLSWLTVSSFAVLGSPLCHDTLQQLIDQEAIPDYEDLKIEIDTSYSEVLLITTVRASGQFAPHWGLQYEKCLGLTITQSDGEPLPSFMSFDPLTRTLKANPTSSDTGVYQFRVNFNYLDELDPDYLPKIVAHSVPLTVEVVDPTELADVSEFFIPENTEEDKEDESEVES